VVEASKGLKSVIQLLSGKKFCVVKDGIFFIFEKNTSKKPTGSFPLQGNAIVDRPLLSIYF